MSYRLKLSTSIKRLQLAFNIVKLTPILIDPILDKYEALLLDLVTVNSKEK